MSMSSEVLRAAESCREPALKLAIYERNADLSRKLRDMKKMSFEKGAATRIALDQAQRDHVVVNLKLALGRISTELARFDIDVVTGEILKRFNRK